jgi:methylmalonyl-CoA decarboxylase subunit alpha
VTDWQPLLDDLQARRQVASAMGGEQRLARQHTAGKLDARQRIAALCDPGSAVEIGALAGSLPADAFVAVIGRVDGRFVAIGAEDFTVAGGSIGAANSAKRHRLVTLAGERGIPLVMLLDGAGHRPPLPTDAPSVRSPNDLQALADLRSQVPIAVGVLGPSAGHGALAAPLAHFTVMTQTASIFSAGPPLVKASTGEDVDRMTLGGPSVALASGVIHNVADDDHDALLQIRQWLGYVCHARAGQAVAPPSDADTAERVVDEVLEIVPRDPRRAYDMVDVIEVMADEGTWFEVQARFGASLLTGLARVGGRVVAIVANQPRVLAGAIDVAAAGKAADFIDTMESFGVPLLFLTDNPGVLAGTVSERAGILRASSRMFLAQRRARSPKLQVTLRKAYGFGSSVMSMNPFDRQVLNVAFPGVTFGAMPARGADAATGADESTAAALATAERESAYRSAAGLSVDDIIDPRQLRNVVLRALALAAAS